MIVLRLWCYSTSNILLIWQSTKRLSIGAVIPSTGLVWLFFLSTNNSSSTMLGTSSTSRITLFSSLFISKRAILKRKNFYNCCFNTMWSFCSCRTSKLSCWDSLLRTLTWRGSFLMISTCNKILINNKWRLIWF